MRTGLTIVALAALLAGCGGAKKSFDDSFNKSFHENFISSCTSSAVRSGLAQELAAKVCTCTSDNVKERFSVQEKMNLKPEQVTPLVAECRSTILGTEGQNG